MSSKNRLLVVGGNGYLGSAICRAAVARGWSVSSFSSSGNPATTPAGHRRSWTTQVTWHRASAFTPSTYAHLVRDSTAVVHTLGILMEGEYKKFVRGGNVGGLVREVLRGKVGGGAGGGENPLLRGLGAVGEGEDGKDKDKRSRVGSYEAMNRDSALTVLHTYLSNLPPTTTPTSPTPDRPFIYISAENIFTPFIPAKYVQTKREAEVGIERLIGEYRRGLGVGVGAGAGGGGVRGVYIRPGLMYHPHERPLSTLPAALLDLTSRLSNHLPFSLFPRSSPSSSNLTTPPPRHLLSNPLETLSSLSSSLSIPPIHVDQVAECVLRSIENERVKGVVDTRDMRRWVGLDEPGWEGEEVVLPRGREGVVVGQRGGHGKVVPSSGSIPGKVGSGPGGPGVRGYSTKVARSIGGRRGLTVYAPGPGQGSVGSNEQGYSIELPSPGQSGSGEPNMAGSSPSSSSSQGRKGNDQVIDAAAVIAASAASSNSTSSSSGTTNPGTMGRSNHPYANMGQVVPESSVGETMQDPMTLLPPPPMAQNGSNEGGRADAPGQDQQARSESTTDRPKATDQGSAQQVGSEAPRHATIVPQHPTPAHPFDTHAFVTHLETSGFATASAHSLMLIVRSLLLTRSTRAQTDLLHKEDVENAAYLFKAALSELRTELNVRARNDGLALRSATNLIRREVDTLDQRMKEEVGGLKHDIEMDMNNRKGETRSEQKAYEISIEEINNKFTISLGDLKTEIEQAKWDATRRAITILAAIVFTVISVVTLTSDTAKPIPPPPASLPSADGKEEKKYRDMAVGDDPLNLRADDEEAMIRIRGLEADGRLRV